MALCFEGASLLTHSPVTHVLGGSEQQPLHEPQPGCWWMPEAAMGMSRLSGRFTLRYWGCGTHQHSCRKTGSYQSRHRFLGTLCLLCRLFLSTSGCLQQCPERHLCGRHNVSWTMVQRLWRCRRCAQEEVSGREEPVACSAVTQWSVLPRGRRGCVPTATLLPGRSLLPSLLKNYEISLVGGVLFIVIFH